MFKLLENELFGFKDKERNNQFIIWQYQYSTKQIHYILALTGIIYIIMGVSNIFLAPVYLHSMLIPYQIFIMPSYAFLISFLAYKKIKLQTLEFLLLSAPILAALSHAIIFSYMDAYSISQAELYLMIFWIFTISGLRFIKSIIAAFTVFTIGEIYPYFSYENQLNEFLVHTIWMIVSMLFGIVGGFLLHQSKKSTFEKELELVNAKEEALASSKSKSDFLASMSHEIRTPLNAIMGFIDLLQIKENDTTKLYYLKTINKSSKSLNGIINDILDFSKIESGNFELDYIDFDPVDELKSTHDLFQAKCEEKSIHLHMNFKDVPDYLEGDILRIKQVLNNLLSNAVKFTKDNKNIIINIEYKHNNLIVSVKDEGIGISAEYKNNIFKSFTQADSSTTRQYGGTGLGLSISYNLVKLMNGELKLKSELGKGSEFYFSIPLNIGHETKKKVLKYKDIILDPIKILVVEDNKANQMFMIAMLDSIEQECDIASDGVEALEFFKKNKYDIILMDENMPNMNGIIATQEILKIEKDKNLEHTQIVALTANALKGDRERFLEAGMDDYLSKPLEKDRLIEVLHKLNSQL